MKFIHVPNPRQNPGLGPGLKKYSVDLFVWRMLFLFCEGNWAPEKMLVLSHHPKEIGYR